MSLTAPSVSAHSQPMNTMHPFEKAGLGKAPFICTGVSENWYSPAGFPEHRQPGGSCAFCGTGILYEYSILSDDGRKFVVGSDCVERTAAAVGEFRTFRLKLARDQRAAKRVKRDAAWKAERDAQYAAGREANAARLAARQDAFRAAYPELVAFIESKAAPVGTVGRNDFVADMASSFHAYGDLSEKQTAAVRGIMDREAQRGADRANSRHFGVVGKPVTLEATVVKVLSFFGEYMGRATTTYINILRASDGNVAVYKGSTSMGATGQRIRCTFTVKEHGEREGVNQTILARPRKWVAL